MNVYIDEAAELRADAPNMSLPTGEELQKLIDSAVSSITNPRHQNESPRGPGSVRKPLTGRALRRAQGQINRNPVYLVAHKNEQNEHPIPSTRAPKRVGGSRKTVR